MTRLSGKQVIERSLPVGRTQTADFNQSEIYLLIRDKGYDVIWEKSYMCPCKSKSGTVLQTCKNCNGSGYLFANPTKTRMIIHSISNQRKYEPQGQQDLGMVEITAYEEDKLSQMDRITIVDATTEHKEILYPTLTDDDTQLFAYTKYSIKSVDYMAMFVEADQKLVKLEEPADYTFLDNVVKFNAKYNTNLDMSVTVRYVHAPVYYVWNIARDAMRSTVVTNGVRQNIVLPVHALGKRAHMVLDAENYVGDRVLDNSWLPNACEVEPLTDFQRQLLYTDVSSIYSSLSDTQKVELAALINQDGTLLGVNGGVLQINP